MNYQKHYDQLMTTRKLLNRKKSKDEYFERHHIIPKIFGGDDANNNLVLLTAREHYIAHKLLWKATKNTKLAFAFVSMAFTNKKYRKLTSIQYEYARRTQAGFISEYNKGRKCTPDHIAKIIAFHTGRKRTEETKQKMREAWKQRRIQGITEETRERMKEAQRKKWNDNKKSEKLREDARQRKIEFNKIFNSTEFICPHCGKIGKGPNMKRYHFDKCKDYNNGN